MPESDSTRLNDLKQRWVQDPGSRLYLQLADEHIDAGSTAENPDHQRQQSAETGLEHNGEKCTRHTEKL